MIFQTILFVFCNQHLDRKENKATYITKGVINNSRIEIFKQDLYQTSWDDAINNKNMNGAYNYQYARLLFTIGIFQNKI